jgi:hypothetical protein
VAGVGVERFGLKDDAIGSAAEEDLVLVGVEKDGVRGDARVR